MIWDLIGILVISCGLAVCGLILRDEVIEIKRNKERIRRIGLGLCFDCGKPFIGSEFICDKGDPC